MSSPLPHVSSYGSISNSRYIEKAESSMGELPWDTSISLVLKRFLGGLSNFGVMEERHGY